MAGKNAIDHTGERFGKLTAVSQGPRNKWGHLSWNCICDCGAEITTGGRQLRTGDTRSCGCLAVERLIARNTTHGQARHIADNTIRGMYQSWADMKSRCHNPKVKAYARYGGRGIEVCGRWLSFDNFAEDMTATWEPGLSIDRIDVDGNYEQSNCRWITRAENSRRAAKK